MYYLEIQFRCGPDLYIFVLLIALFYTHYTAQFFRTKSPQHHRKHVPVPQCMQQQQLMNGAVRMNLMLVRESWQRREKEVGN